jgi:hypothetical protein
MTFYVAVNEAPLVIQFTGEFPEDVMREAADYLTEARDRGETLTSWTVWPDLRDGDPLWHGTLTTAGAGLVEERRSSPWSTTEATPVVQYVAPWADTPEGEPALADWENELLAGDDPQQSEYTAWLDDVQSDIGEPVDG